MPLLDEEEIQRMTAKLDRMPFRNEETKDELRELYRKGWDSPEDGLRYHREILNRHGEKEVLELYEKSVREQAARKIKRDGAEQA